MEVLFEEDQPETVGLWCGRRIAVAALQLLVKLEFRGCTNLDEPSCTFRVAEDGQLFVTTPSTWTLTTEDRARIRRWREDLKYVVQYQGWPDWNDPVQWR
jgi:hypothetical protein